MLGVLTYLLYLLSKPNIPKYVRMCRKGTAIFSYLQHCGTFPDTFC